MSEPPSRRTVTGRKVRHTHTTGGVNNTTQNRCMATTA